MTTCYPACYATSSFPEPVAVTQTLNEITVEAGKVIPVLSFSRDLDTSGRLLVQTQIDGADVSGRYKIVVWFEDSADFSGLVSMDPPTTPGASMLEYITDADGTLVELVGATPTDGMLVQDSASPAKTWYAYARIGGNVCDSPVAVILGT